MKHMVFNSIKSYKLKFQKDYGDIVICCDGRNSWRKEFFPYYKANRKKDRENSKRNWKEIYQTIDGLKQDLRNYFPYKIIEIDGAEADDVIAIISMTEKNPIIIIGTDKDYKQLQKYPNVRQYSPKDKDFITVEDANLELQKLIIKGDSSDGIPNIRSDSDTFVNENKKQNTITAKNLESWTKMEKIDYCTSKQMLDNYLRNEILISFDKIPENIAIAIKFEYSKQTPSKDKQKMFNYFIQNRMASLLHDVNSF